MDKNLSNCQNADIRTVALAATFYFEQVFIFRMLIMKTCYNGFY